ncbi:hypothetical protein [Sanguibacter gelidistatuariae]|uniref:hypothetical protein n=1 Tax=Sanguibacter gelidistatuariae TaxID=1814289 RepID=UPI001FE0BBA2|nr:hypothetical protein [Sanguibacter gelidistatuariae]
MEDSANCNLCANCIKSCPNDAIQVRLRKPTSELWFITKPKIEHSYQAMAIMGIVLIQNITMLEVWTDVLVWIEATTGVASYALIFTVAFVIAVTVPVALLTLASRIAAAGNLEDTAMNFARFGYALIPLDVAAHLAHNLFHLLAEGGSVYTAVVALFGVEARGVNPALLSTGTIQVLQFALLGLGVAGSSYTARRIAHRRYRTSARRRATLIPYAAIIALLGAMNVWMFLLPMAHRM